MNSYKCVIIILIALQFNKTLMRYGTNLFHLHLLFPGFGGGQ